MSKKIKFKFEANQEHQRIAVDSAVRLFEGLPQFETTFQMVGEETIANLPEYYSLEENWLLSNLNAVQRRNGLVENIALDADEGLVLDGLPMESSKFPVYTVEMETGTGKTYTYLKTIHEYRKHYGFRKFIIVVPSIAIYQGTKKAFEMTEEHFKTLYGNEPIHITAYDGQQISKLRSYATSSFTEIMIITLDSFNKSTNIIYKPTEKLPGEKLPYQYIQETRPILILDESQNYRSDLSRKALRSLHPLFAINYSATPINKPNLIYRLSPVDAFKMNLVKKIQVIGIKEEYNLNNPQQSLALESIDSSARYGWSAKIRLHTNDKGTLKEKVFDLHKNEDLFEKTKNESYRGIVIDTISKKDGVVIFGNGEQITLNDESAPSLTKEDIFRNQIGETIKQHIARQNELLDKGIKVLSLFFIDRVANYKDEDGIIKRLFDEAFEKQKDNCELLKKHSASDVREGYFAQKKTKKGEVEFIDTPVDEAKKTKEEKELERAAFELIMTKKEVLLSLDEKVSFIFAHSALKEGWDNPNVFQICTLNQTVSETKKRQEIGRGLRLAVGQNGERVTDEGINVLTVVANESYQSYVESLQGEYIESGDVAPPPPTDPRKSEAKRNDRIFKGKDFRLFWDKLCQRTSYTINIDSKELVNECIAIINKQQFPEPQIAITKGTFVITDFVIELTATLVDMAKIKLTISDTDGNNLSSEQWYKRGADFAKVLKDERLKGFKIVEINNSGEDSTVFFGDKGQLKKYGPIKFQVAMGKQTDPRTVMEAHPDYPIPNLIDRASRETQLTKPTVLDIFKGLREDKKQYIFKNPEGFVSIFITATNNQLASHVAGKIVYAISKDLENYEMEKVFPPVKKFPQKELLDGTTNSLYNLIQVDSDIERRFLQTRLQPDDMDGNIVCYFKFPSTFKINIPKIIGNYNPDWGIIREDKVGNFKLQLVRETKGNMDPNLLQWPSEKRKIDCAKKHFKEIGVDYRQITDQIPNWWVKES